MGLRCYILVHSHLSTVQKGIQAAHAVAELVASASDAVASDWRKEAIKNWVKNEKTICLLEGGNSAELEFKVSLIENSGEPSAFFREDERTLSSMITAVAVIVNPQAAFVNNRLVDMIQTSVLVRQ